ncbi:MAG: GTP-binding protein, partial [Pseudomonadota bacterium]
IEARVKEELRPGIRMVRSNQKGLPPAVLLGLDAAAEDDLDSRKSHHDDGEDHEHDDFESFHVELAAITSPDDFVEQLRNTIRVHGVLRVKGFIEVEGKPMRLAVQGVGDRLQHYFDRPWQDGEARRSRLVVIGEHGLNQQGIAQVLGAVGKLAA